MLINDESQKLFFRFQNIRKGLINHVIASAELYIWLLYCLWFIIAIFFILN